MPREFFRSEHDTPESTAPQVTVGWDRSPGIQMGVIHSPAEARAFIKAQLAGKDQFIEPEIDRIAELLTEPHSPAMGWHTILGRSEVNRLIRTLRRARDAAFGADA